MLCGRVLVSGESLVNLASGAVATCSSVYSTYRPCEGAIDGQIPSNSGVTDGTVWYGNTRMYTVDRDSISLDFASERIVFRLELYYLCYQVDQCSEIDATFGDGSTIRVTT